MYVNVSARACVYVCVCSVCVSVCILCVVYVCVCVLCESVCVGCVFVCARECVCV